MLLDVGEHYQIKGAIPDEYLIDYLLRNQSILVMLMAEFDDQIDWYENYCGCVEYEEDCHLFLMAAVEELLRADMETGGHDGRDWFNARR